MFIYFHLLPGRNITYPNVTLVFTGIFPWKDFMLHSVYVTWSVL